MTDGIFILSGSNIGDRHQHLNKAAEHLIDSGIRILNRSSIYKSEAWGPVKQDDFLNLVLEVETTFDAFQVLDRLLEIEVAMGRKRDAKWGPRIIDLDLLYYNQEVIRTKNLTLPHPFIPERRFTLLPLTELAPAFVHPILKKTQAELLSQCKDDSEVYVQSH